MFKKSLPIVLGLGLFALILKRVDLGATWDLLKTADPKLCLAAFLSLVLMVYLKGLRWSFLLRLQGHRYSVWNCFLIYMGSLFWGNVTPGRAGDFMKVLYLKDDLGLSIGAGMSSVLVDRVFDLYLLLILGSFGILAYPGALGLSPQVVHLIWIFFGLLIAASLVAFNRTVGEALIRLVFERVLGPKLKEKAGQAFGDFHAGMEAFYSPRVLFPALLSLLSYALFFEGSSWMAQALGLSINIFYLSFCLSVVNIVSLLTLLGMGTREGTLILLFGFIGLSQSQALAYSLLIFFVGTVLFTLLCFLCFLLKPIRFKNAF
ncbi:MAG TPA: lysylphosphatidylglycerol synthase transmembrane domain-containing protein [bacterium]|nr:lysylphosphatidylglycerol synthase transmembrane domain-containing protein [bacterium]